MLGMLSFEFMQRAFLSALMMSIIAPLLGIFLVIRRQSLLADTLSHVSLSGVALGLLLGINPSLSTIFIVIIAAIFLEYLRRVYKSYSEISIAILMSGGLAFALILMSLNQGTTIQSINQFLFGSIITISWNQVYQLIALFIVIVVLFLLFRRQMYVLTFDEDIAHVDGLNINFISILFNIICGIAIALMIPIAGALLVSAIMVLPAAIGMRIGKTFNKVILSGIIVGIIGTLSGLTTSFYLESPPGASITAIFIVIFIFVSIIKNTWMKIQRKQV